MPYGQSCAQGGEGGASGDDSLIEGSFDLLFAETKGLSKVSQGTSARIDIRKAADGLHYEALFTSSLNFTSTFFDTQQMDVYLTPGQVMLNGNGLVGNPDVPDDWYALRLGRTAAGGLDGTMTGSGFLGSPSFPLEATGTIGPDVTPPVFDALPGPADSVRDWFLPWESFRLQFSEGLDQAAVTEALTLRVGGSAVADPVLDFAFTAGLWGGASRVEVRSPHWDLPTAEDSTIQLAVAAGVPDGVGNKGAAFSISAKRRAVAPGGKVHSFDSDALDVTTWGATTHLGGTTADPLCEQGGCVQFGPFDLGYCSPEPLGFAGRAPYAGESTLSIRYRLYLKGEAGTPPSIFGQSLFGVVYTSTGAVGARVPQPGTEPLTDLGEQAGELRWATDWITLDVPIIFGTQADEIGFVVGSPTDPRCGDVPASTKAQILIDSVTLH